MYIFGVLSMFYLISKKHQKTGSLFSDGQQPWQILIHNNHKDEVRLGPLGQCMEENKNREEKNSKLRNKKYIIKYSHQ